MRKDEEQLVEPTNKEIAIILSAIPVLIFATMCLARVLGITELMI